MIFGPSFPKSRDELRENFYRLFQRSYVLSAKQGAGLHVYRSSAAILGRMFAENWVQHTIFPGESALVRQFLAQTGLAADADAALRKSLLLHAWTATWRPALQRLGRDEFATLCDVTGAEHLQAALATRRGVVVAHCHRLFAPLFWSWLETRKIAPGVTIGHWAWEQQRKKESSRSDPRDWVPEVARELREAVASLRSGGLAHIFADGVQGKREIVLPFCGRRRGFRPAFAELAISTGALVLSATVSIASHGRIAIAIAPPMAEGEAGGHAAGADRAARIEGLVRQFALRLEAAWREDPAQLPWGDMRTHLEMPAL